MLPLSGAGSVSLNMASAMLGANDGVAFSFLDMSCVVKDGVTPANNFSGSPATWLTYTTPSTKWILGANGLYAAGTTLRQAYDVNGKAVGLISEDTATTLTTFSRRLDNAAWTKTNVNTATTTGVDGVSTSATRITATAPNGTVLNPAVTLVSAARRLAPFVKQITGTGALQWTLDGGLTWTSFTGVTGVYQRIGVGKTVANPQVGFKIVTSGDAFDIDFANGETNSTGAYDTSPMESLATVFVRNADFISTSAMPAITTAGTAAIEFSTPQTTWVASTGTMGVSVLGRFVYSGAANVFQEYDGTNLNLYPGVIFTPNSIIKAGLSWSGTSITLALEGLVAASAPFATPFPAGAVYFGSFSSNNQNCIITQALVSPTPRSAAFLQMITT